MALEDELIEDLTAELSVADPMFETYSSMVAIKVKTAIREVKKARRYPADYSNKTVEDDLENYYSQIRNIALYDYNSVGEEFQTSHSEAGTSHSKVDRDSLFNGIIPICAVI